MLLLLLFLLLLLLLLLPDKLPAKSDIYVPSFFRRDEIDIWARLGAEKGLCEKGGQGSNGMTISPFPLK